ncbi:MAG: hypothetical protein AABY22_29945 [Nanoarchaeota archaeon]
MKKPVKLIKCPSGYVLVSDDKIEKGDTVYTKEKGRAMIGRVVTVRSEHALKVAVGDLVYSFYDCKKVIAVPIEVGYVEIVDGEFEGLTEAIAKNIIKKGGNCFIEWNFIYAPTMNAELSKPFFVNGKVLIYEEKKENGFG